MIAYPYLHDPVTMALLSLVCASVSCISHSGRSALSSKAKRISPIVLRILKSHSGLSVLTLYSVPYSPFSIRKVNNTSFPIPSIAILSLNTSFSRSTIVRFALSKGLPRHRLLFICQCRLLMWCLPAYFVLSCCCDCSYFLSISRL